MYAARCLVHVEGQAWVPANGTGQWVRSSRSSTTAER